MGIVVKQSSYNLVFTLIGFVIGAINTMYLYVHFLPKDFYGLTAYLLSTANLIMPFFAFGLNHAVIKYYNLYNNIDRQKFINLVLLLPLVIIVPIIILVSFNYDFFADALARKNKISYDYLWVLIGVGVAMAYFEIFYAISRIHLKSIGGNILKEVGLRLIVSLALLAAGFDLMTPETFIYFLVGVYSLITLLMAFFAFKNHRPNFSVGIKIDTKDFITYCFFIIFSSSIAIYLLDLDKFMLGQMLQIENVAFYLVASFIATTIAVPQRAMHQITHPLTAKMMAKSAWEELDELYKKSSLTLQIVSGLILVGVLINLKQIYTFLPRDYDQGFWVVLFIAFAKYYDSLLGNNNSIVFNSKYYKTILFLGLALILLAFGFNLWLIPIYGLNGAALATLLAVIAYNTTKMYFVVFKMKLFPFQKGTWQSALILLATILLFFFWDFSFHPLLNIVLKSILVSGFYGGLHYFLKVSTDVNQLAQKAINFVLRR
jgi:O-antigen/teichoic acid export membrane protein